jgi:hypothetical protein
LLYADNVLHGLSSFITLQPGLFHQPIPDYISSVSFLGGLTMLILILLLGISVTLLFSSVLIHRLAAASFLFYCMALLPTGGLILFGNYAFGDRYLYLSSVGLYLIVFILLSYALQKFRGGRGWWVINTLALLVIGAAFFSSFEVLPKWSSSKSVWMYDIDRRPDAVLANQKMGYYHFERKEYQLAQQYFAVTIDSRSEPFRVHPRLTSALYLAEIFCATGRNEVAIGVLAQIPKFGGDISAVEGLLTSLQFSGHRSCHNDISRWYESTRD